MAKSETLLQRHPESILFSDYLKQRDMGVELFWSSVQKNIAGGVNSPCKSSNRWTSATNEGCGLYHSYFPTAEMIEMVSSPIHHPELYLDSLRKLVPQDEAEIWIPAFATPRTYDMVRFAKPHAKVLATDLCVSPVLALGNIFHDDLKDGLLVGSQLDILTAQYENKFDAIVTDAFITRFTGETKRKVLQILHRALKPGGALLTTVRVPKHGEEKMDQLLEKLTIESEDYPQKVRKAYVDLLKVHGKKNAEFIPYNPEEIEQDALRYQNSMRSSHGKEEEEVLGIALLPKLATLPGAAAYGQILTLPPEQGGIGFIKTEIKRSQPVYDISTREYLQITAVK